MKSHSDVKNSQPGILIKPAVSAANPGTVG